LAAFFVRTQPAARPLAKTVHSTVS
jgi:hypothetical protein